MSKTLNLPVTFRSHHITSENMSTFLRSSAHLRRLLHRHISPALPHLLPQPPPVLKPYSHFLTTFSSQPQQVNDQITLSLSSELVKTPQQVNDQATLSLSQRLELSFSHITITPQLILDTLNHSPLAGRAGLDFFKWVSSKSGLTDEVISYFVDYFGRRKDFKIIPHVLVEGKGVIGVQTFGSFVDRLIRAGRATQAVSFFNCMDKDYGIVRDRDKFNYVVSQLCQHGYANYAEKMVKSLANEFFPDEYVCDVLIQGWCVDSKLEEAKRLAREMYRGGFEIGTGAYNAILDCVCKLCRVKDPFRLQSEAQNLLLDMDAAGVPRNTQTFNVLISNLCKIRKTEEGLKLFSRMGEWGCYPDATTFLLLTRSLYQAARVGEGDEMIDRMKSAGYGADLNKKEYYGFLKILCGIERIDHAFSVFRKMKKDGCTPGVKTYELLIGKLHAHGRAEKANNLFNEAVSNGVLIERKDYKVDPRFLEKPNVVKKGKKHLTLPEKMVLKRKKLRKIRLSYVKKPKKMMRRAL